MGLPLRAIEWKHWLSGKEKILGTAVSKVMPTLFWDMKGPITIDFLEEGATINARRWSLLTLFWHLVCMYLKEEWGWIVCLVSNRKKRVSCNWTCGINFKCCCCIIFLIEGGQLNFYSENVSSRSFFLWISFFPPATIFLSSPTPRLVSCRVSPRLKTPLCPRCIQAGLK